jgi:death-on-curing protein
VTARRWLTVEMVAAIHDEALYAFGGLAGIRDAGLLESAMDRPRNRLAFELAAALGFGITKNHPFIDGNKRTALLAMRAFLFLNGYALEPREEDEVLVMIGVAANEVTEGELASWLKANSARARRGS